MTAPLVAGDGTHLTGDRAFLADIDAPWAQSFCLVRTLLLVVGARLDCDGANPSGFRTSVCALWLDIAASVALEHFLCLKVAPL